MPPYDVLDPEQAKPTITRQLYFPKTRYQGSKRKCIQELQAVFEKYSGVRALDLYSGSGTVTLLLRELGFSVWSNDYLQYANNTAQLFLTLNKSTLAETDWYALLSEMLYEQALPYPTAISNNYSGIFFTDEENRQVDRFCQNLHTIDSPLQKAVLIYAVGQALLMKRPYNLFHRANLHMRLKKVERSFGNYATWSKPILSHAVNVIKELNKICLVENENKHHVSNINTNKLDEFEHFQPEIIYLDPPYIAQNAQPVDYADFYHFLEGLLDYSLFQSSAKAAKHKPIVNKQSSWLNATNAETELNNIVQRWNNASIIMSYRDDGNPTIDRLLELLSQSGRKARVVESRRYQYALAHSKTSREVIIVAD